MNEVLFTIQCEPIHIDDCQYAILVPQQALTGARIVLIGGETDSQSKHSLHALSQMAYYQFQDNELEPITIHGNCTLTGKSVSETMDNGLIIVMQKSGVISILLHPELKAKSLLEAAHRYCTRWVRLDI